MSVRCLRHNHGTLFSVGWISSNNHQDSIPVNVLQLRNGLNEPAAISGPKVCYRKATGPLIIPTYGLVTCKWKVI